jgi:hypothetical protein
MFFGSVKISPSPRLRRTGLRASPYGFLFSNTNIFCFGKETQGFLAAFAANAALFHSAERDA